MTAHRPFMLVGRDAPAHFAPANDSAAFDATADEDEGIDEVTGVAATVALAAMWVAEHWPALLVGFWLGTIVLSLIEFAVLGSLR